jgi:hypothetical protein
MTANEFNSKYKEFLVDGHYGLDIHNREAIEYLDSKFKEFTKNPDFKYTQIKTKFDTARFYCHGLTNAETHDVEKELEKILKLN